MKAYFGLGSNLDDRARNIERAIKEFKKHQVKVLRCSSFYESESLVPSGSPRGWYEPYLNVIVEAEVERSPLDLLIVCKEIEKDMGRKTSERWAPRVIDIDLLILGNRTFDEDGIKIPHPQLNTRAFFLDPLAQMIPQFEVPETGKTILQMSREASQHTPAIMGIMNLTPDSFSEAGSFKTLDDFEKDIDTWISERVDVIDLGAESTRPGAKTLTDLEEWTRLSPALEIVKDKIKKPFSPRVSVDTYHPSTARKAIDLGARVINDVSGLRNPEMVEVVKESGVDVIAVHNLGIPADKSNVIPDEDDPRKVLSEWAETQLVNWEKDGLDFERIIIDPGIGFGKTAYQSLQILKAFEKLQEYGLRVMIGHSRKSFMDLFTAKDLKQRDFETIGASLKLTQQGVDMLRVHNPVAHRRALRAWTAVESRDAKL